MRDAEGTTMDDETLPLPPTPAPPGVPHIYVINSDEEFLETIGDLLSDARVRVTLEQMRPNIEVTVANLRSAQPDLLILDVVPHRADAQLLLDRMRADPELGQIPVLAASTNSDLAERVAASYAPLVCAVLPKPFEVEEFFATLRHLKVPLQVP
jgi:DNA-binding response OmpR family regulator